MKIKNWLLKIAYFCELQNRKSLPEKVGLFEFFVRIVLFSIVLAIGAVVFLVGRAILWSWDKVEDTKMPFWLYHIGGFFIAKKPFQENGEMLWRPYSKWPTIRGNNIEPGQMINLLSSSFMLHFIFTYSEEIFSPNLYALMGLIFYLPLFTYTVLRLTGLYKPCRDFLYEKTTIKIAS